MPPEWSTACLDWRERLKRGDHLISFPPLFPAEAAAAMDIFRDLRIVDAPGSPTFGHSASPWVIEFAEAIFGAYDHDVGKRLIREFFLLISKKNGKSTIAAAIMLTALLRNWRRSAEFLILAPTIEVANNSYIPCRDMVRANPELEALLHVQDHLKTITHRATGATLKVVAADNETVSGKKATGVLVDELWLFGKRAHAENMLREATGGLVSRPEGFVVYLSTQSDEPPAGVFRQKLQYFRDVRDGKILDPRSLPVIYEWPEEMEAAEAYLEPKYWHITNPNLGVSVSTEWLADELQKAKAAGKHSLIGFAAKHLNVEIGQSLGSDGWTGAEYWENCTDPTLTLETLLARSEVVTVGVDMGGTDDLFSVCLIGRERGTDDVHWRRWLVWQHSWCCQKAIERRKGEASKYFDFVEAGDLTIVDTEREQIDQAVELISRVYDAGLLAGIGADPWMMRALVDAVDVAGIRPPEGAGTSSFFEGVRQGSTIGLVAQAVEWKLRDKSLFHGGQPLLAYAIGNMKVEMKGNAPAIYKANAGSAKIDPAMAMFDAASVMGRNPEAAAAAPEIYVI